MDPNHPIDVDMLSSESSDGSDNDFAIELVERPTYKCKYCPKSFSTAQALGGHQNAHKKERRDQAMLASMNQLYPDPVPSQYSFPPGFEQAGYTVDGPDNLTVAENQGMDQPVMTPPLLNLFPTSQSPSLNLNICLGVGNRSQAQTQPKEPSEDDDDLSLSLSLRL